MTYSFCRNMSCNAAKAGASFAARALSVLVSIAVAMLIFIFGLLPLLVVVLVGLILVGAKNRICPCR